VPDEKSEQWATHASESWREGTIKLAVHPGAGKAENIWKPENFATVVNRLARDSALSLVIIQGPADAETVKAFQSACEIPGYVVSGRSITDVAALLKRADLVVCNDTGVMHVACAAGARVLAIFGLTDPVRWAPRSPGLRVVRAPEGDLRSLEPETVAREAESYLEVNNAGSA
jgi:ADP-heptose:LPS heptosyltransferase